MYLANKVQNIQGAADTLLELADLDQDEIRPVAEAMERGGRLAAKAQVTDAILDKCKPIAGTPDDCIAAIEEYRDAGCTHVMLELWGDRPPRADRALRRAGAAALPMSDDATALVDLAAAARLDAVASPARSRRGRAHRARARARSGCTCSGSRSRRAAPTSLGDLAGRGRRAEPDVQRPHGHVVLRPRAVARRASRASSRRAFERGRAHLRARHLEHEGRARLLRRGGARAAGRGRAPARRRARRGRRAARSRRRSGATRRAPSTAATRPARATSSPTAASPTCASSASRPRTRSCSATSARSGCGSRRAGPFVHTAFSEGRRRRTRSCACASVLDAVLEWIPSWEEEMTLRRRARRRNVGAIRGGFGWRVSRTPHATDLFLDVRVPPTMPMAEARRAGARVRALAPPTGRRGGGLRHRARAPRSPRTTRWSARSTQAHAEVFGAPPERDVDALVLRRVRAHALRHRRRSTTAPRAACPTPSSARTSRSTGS